MRRALCRRSQTGRLQRGAALIIAIHVAADRHPIGVTGLVAASLELQMSGNFQYQERAFQAAEFAIEQALHSAPLSTAYTLASPKFSSAWCRGARAWLRDRHLHLPPVLRHECGQHADSQRFQHAARPGRLPLRDLGTGQSSARRAGNAHAGLLRARLQRIATSPLRQCNFDGAERTKTYWVQQGAE